jgi:hypothetical protein
MLPEKYASKTCAEIFGILKLTCTYFCKIFLLKTNEFAIHLFWLFFWRVEDGYIYTPKIACSVETTFQLCGDINLHNLSIWISKNPHEVTEHIRHSPKFWCLPGHPQSPLWTSVQYRHKNVIILRTQTSLILDRVLFSPWVILQYTHVQFMCMYNLYSAKLPVRF